MTTPLPFANAVLGEPTCMTEGPTAGESWVYFLAPWGMQLELVSYPQGKAYSRQSPVAGPIRVAPFSVRL